LLSQPSSSSPPRFSISARANGSNNMLEDITLIAITLALFGYLLVALLRAEDF
jgi:K+-transporting ATPase KdpF subunit